MTTKDAIIEAIKERLGYGYMVGTIWDEKVEVDGFTEERYIFTIEGVDVHVDIRENELRFEYRIHGTDRYSGLSYPKTLKGLVGKIERVVKR